jgi:hypothetical protein
VKNILLIVKRGAGFGYGSPTSKICTLLDKQTDINYRIITSGSSLNILTKLGIPVDDNSAVKAVQDSNHLIYPNEVAETLAYGIARMGKIDCIVSIGEYFVPRICHDAGIPSIFIGNLTYYSRNKLQNLSDVDFISTQASINSVKKSQAIFHLGALNFEELDLPDTLREKHVASKPPITLDILELKTFPEDEKRILIYTGSPILGTLGERPDKASVDDYKKCAERMTSGTIEGLKKLKEECPDIAIPYACDIVTAYPDETKEAYKDDSLFKEMQIVNFIPNIDTTLYKYKFCVVRGGANIVSSCICQKIRTFSIATEQDEQQISELALLQEFSYVQGMVSDSGENNKLFEWMKDILQEDKHYPEKDEFYERQDFAPAFIEVLNKIIR